MAYTDENMNTNITDDHMDGHIQTLEEHIQEGINDSITETAQTWAVTSGQFVDKLNYGACYIHPWLAEMGEHYHVSLESAETYDSLYNGALCKWCTGSIGNSGDCECTAFPHPDDITTLAPQDDADITRIIDYSLQMFHNYTEKPSSFVKDTFVCTRPPVPTDESPASRHARLSLNYRLECIQNSLKSGHWQTLRILDVIFDFVGEIQPIFVEDGPSVSHYKDLVKHNLPILRELTTYLARHEIVGVIEQEERFRPLVVHLARAVSWCTTLANTLFDVITSD